MDRARIPMPYDGLTDKCGINTGIVLALAASAGFQSRQNSCTHSRWHGVVCTERLASYQSPLVISKEGGEEGLKISQINR